MSKLTLSLVLVASLASQLASSDPLEPLEPMERAEVDVETELLLGDERLFADFCRESRQFVLGELERSSREPSPSLLGQFLGSASGLAEDVVAAERGAVAELSGRLAPAEPSAEPGAPLPEKRLGQLIEQGKREIQRAAAGQPGAKGAAAAMLSVADSALFVKLAQARSRLDSGTLLASIRTACDQIRAHGEWLEQSLVAYMDKVASEQDDSELLKFLGTVKVSNIRCQTTRNVVRLGAFCELFKNGQGAFMKMLALEGTL